jgi:aryl-alcohol dehydrogenase-like predicted oxidoreductase
LDEDEAFEAMKAAIHAGATFWNGGVYYGFGPKGELLNLQLVAKFFTKYPEYADKVFLSVKGGFNPAIMAPDGSPEFLKSDVDGILKALDGKKKLDLFEMGRVDKKVYISLLYNLTIVPLNKSLQLLQDSLKKVNSITLDCRRSPPKPSTELQKFTPSQQQNLNSHYGPLKS